MRCHSDAIGAAFDRWERRWRPAVAELGPSAEYASPAYWDAYFTRRAARLPGSPCEWYLEPGEVGEALREAGVLAGGGGGRALHVGCGTSLLGAWLAQHAGMDVVNVDSSAAAIASMQSEHGGRVEGCVWELADVEALPERHRGAYDLVVDKGLLCAALFGGSAVAARILSSCVAALREGGGALVQVTEDPPERRLELLRDALPGWTVTSRARGAADAGYEFYVYTAAAPSPRGDGAEPAPAGAET